MKCPKPKKSKDSKSTEKSDSKKEGTSTAANAEDSSDDEGAWAAEKVNSDDDVSDWFDEAVSEVAGGVDVTVDWFEDTVAAGDDNFPELLALSDSEDESSEVDAGAELQSVVNDVLLRNLSSCLNFESLESVNPVEGVVAIVSDDVIVDDVTDWFEEAVVTEVDDLPELLSISNSEDDASNIKEESTCGDGEVSVEEFLDMSGQAFIVAESVQAAGMAELYDSGCTNHISPYRSHFKNFQSITPCHFRTANKQTFSTTGKGDLVIDIPHGDGVTQLCLLDILYSAEVGYTLVSVGRLDEAGFTVTFGGGKCMLKGKDDEEIGEVPRTSLGMTYSGQIPSSHGPYFTRCRLEACERQYDHRRSTRAHPIQKLLLCLLCLHQSYPEVSSQDERRRESGCFWWRGPLRSVGKGASLVKRWKEVLHYQQTKLS